MNLDHDFFQVSKLSEDQKKRPLAKRKHFLLRIQVETGAQMHIGVKLLEGMQMKTILKLLGGYIPPSPLGFAPLILMYIGGHKSVNR